MIEEKVIKTIRKHSMIDEGDKVLIAFSGGIDSTALVHVLYGLKDRLRIKLYAAHVNHKLRGKDSDLDALFVEKTCRELGIPLFSEDFDIKGFAEQRKMGIEDAARTIRYEYFDRIAAKTGAQKIALAHSADDNIETFLMRLIRGSGLKGLESIPYLRGKIIRPLIEITRAELEEYLRSIKVKARVDRTNRETRFTRNRVRNNLLPALESYNSNIRRVLLRTIAAVSADHDFIRKRSEEMFMKLLISHAGDELTLDIEKLSKLEPAIETEVIRLAIEAVKKDLIDVSFNHIDEIVKLLGSKRAEVDLPGLYVYINKGQLKMSRSQYVNKGASAFSHQLDVPGEINMPEIGLSLESQVLDTYKMNEIRLQDPFQAYLDYDKIERPLTVRNRKDGDSFSPLGLKGKKKLQDIFTDNKVDLDSRDRIPVILSGNSIVWVVGYRISDDVKVTPRTKKVVKIEAKPLGLG